MIKLLKMKIKLLTSLILKAYLEYIHSINKFENSVNKFEKQLKEQPHNSMKEKQIVWVVTEIIFARDNCPSFEIIGVYTEESIAREIYNQSVDYYIDKVELNPKQ